MYLQDLDAEKNEIKNLNFKPNHLLFREINLHRTIDEVKNNHSANKIFRNQKDVPVVVRCNCGKLHPLFEKDNIFQAKWFMSLCEKTKDILVGGEQTYLQIRTKLLAEMD